MRKKFLSTLAAGLLVVFIGATSLVSAEVFMQKVEYGTMAWEVNTYGHIIVIMESITLPQQ